MFTSRMFTQPQMTAPRGGTWLSSIFSGVRSNAGPMVTPDTAMTMTAIQACVTLLAESVA